MTTMHPSIEATFASAAALLLSACSSLGAAGPTGAEIRAMGKDTAIDDRIIVIDLDRSVVSRLAAQRGSTSFAATFGDAPPSADRIGIGDIVDISIWEAPPAVLFGAAMSDPRLTSGAAMASQATGIPQQPVSEDGTITVPFVGSVPIAGRSPAEVERIILTRLAGRAHDPQVIVRLVRNEARGATIIGEVASSRRVALGARGERVLDALASAGGPSRPVDKTTIQIARGGTAVAMPLEQVVRNPAQNIRLMADDVVTLFHQPFSFTALGAVTRNAEIPFEGSGLTLAEAIGRLGGLRDDRADIRGVFVFRMEETAPGTMTQIAAPRVAVPTIYRLDLSDPTSIFLAREFQIEDEDIVYVSTAPGADLQRFVSTLSSAAFSVISLGNAIR